jgi:hypothetical protein
MEYCELCASYSNSTERYRHPFAGIIRVCSECVQVIQNDEPIDDETDNESSESGHSNIAVSGHGSGFPSPSQ